MSARAAEHMGRLPEPEPGKADFKDNDDISAYAKASVKKLYDLGIISGMDDGNFLPLSMCTRAEAAVIIDKLVSLTE